MDMIGGTLRSGFCAAISAAVAISAGAARVPYAGRSSGVKFGPPHGRKSRGPFVSAAGTVLWALGIELCVCCEELSLAGPDGAAAWVAAYGSHRFLPVAPPCSNWFALSRSQSGAVLQGSWCVQGSEPC